MKQITAMDIEYLINIKYRKIEDEKRYAWHLTYDDGLIVIYYGIFSNPIEYVSILLDDKTIERLNATILRDAKHNFFDMVKDRDDMKLNYCY